MKVALISFHSFLKEGGVKRHVFALAKEYEKLGIDAKIIAPRALPNEEYGEGVILLGTSFQIQLGGGITDMVFNFDPISVEACLRKERFDVLHFHNASFPSFFQILLSPFSFQTLNIMTFHSDIARSNLLMGLSKLFQFFVGFCNLRLDGLIGVSRVSMRFFRGFEKPKKIIPNGVDLEEFSPDLPKLSQFQDKKLNLLFVGRIEERKGLIYLLRAYKLLKKEFKNLRLIVVGEGPEKEKCVDFVARENLDDVIFVGEAKNELPLYYVSADIFCAPSIYGESFGLVILEAMASGVPVVGFANQGYLNLLRGKIWEKFLAQPKDWRGLARKLKILIKDRALREKLKGLARKEALHYSWNKIAKRVIDFYKYCKEKKAVAKKRFFV